MHDYCSGFTVKAPKKTLISVYDSMNSSPQIRIFTTGSLRLTGTYGEANLRMQERRWCSRV
jgi:hypothetical protein